MTTKEVSCIVGNVCFVGALLSQNIITWLILTILGMIWLITFIIEIKREARIHRMRMELKCLRDHVAFQRGIKEACLKIASRDHLNKTGKKKK